MRSVKCRITKNDGNERTEQLVKVLKGEEELGFEFPTFMAWPDGGKELSDRATILMLAGLHFLRSQYKKVDTPIVEKPAGW